jgi:hypothetical protein
MEGNTSSACQMLSEYKHIIDYLKNKHQTALETKIKNMIEKMIAKTKTYLTEALKCNAIVLATALSPAFRLSIFRAWSPSHYTRAQALLNKHFTQQHADIEAKANVVNCLASEFDKTRNQAKAIHHHHTVAKVDFFPDASASTHLDELSIYLLGKYKLAASQAGQSLKWWKVCYIFLHFHFDFN